MRAKACQYAAALLDIAEGRSPAEIDQLVAGLRELLAANKQGSLLPSVQKECARLADRRRYRSAATVTVARTLPMESFRRALEKRLGGQVALEQRTDPAIIGGAILRFDDTLVDASIRTAFDRLQQQLMHAPLTPVDF